MVGYVVMLVLNCHIPWGNAFGRETNHLVSRLVKCGALFALPQCTFMCV
jgi:hypothetical protein